MHADGSHSAVQVMRLSMPSFGMRCAFVAKKSVKPAALPSTAHVNVSSPRHCEAVTSCWGLDHYRINPAALLWIQPQR